MNAMTAVNAPAVGVARPPLAVPSSAHFARSSSVGRRLPGMEGVGAGAAASAGRSLVGAASSREPSLGKRGEASASGDALDELLRAPRAQEVSQHRPLVPVRSASHGLPRGSEPSGSAGDNGIRRGAGSGGLGGAGDTGDVGLDFDQEAVKLWARLNLDPSKVENGAHHALDALWRHPVSGGTFFVGNQTAAKRLVLLRQYGITHVVNCTDSMPLYHEAAPESPIVYHRFDVAGHMMRAKNDHAATVFVQPMLDFVESALAEGKNVMVHCLAGAHRAGTTGIICLMHFARLPKKDAIVAAKRLRPIIDPIGSFPELLSKLERGWKASGAP